MGSSIFVLFTKFRMDRFFGGTCHYGIKCILLWLNRPSAKILSGTSGGVFYSTDNGSHWSTANSGLANTTVLSSYTANLSCIIRRQDAAVLSDKKQRCSSGCEFHPEIFTAQLITKYHRSSACAFRC